LIEDREQNLDRVVITLLAVLFSDKHDQRNELIQQGSLDILVVFFGKDLQVRQ
jgi:hypothetical protein